MGKPSAVWKYATRTVPASSVCFIATVAVFSFIISPFGKDDHGLRTATPWQLVLSVYIVSMHILSIVFPIRVTMAVRDVTERMEENATPSQRLKTSPLKALEAKELEVVCPDILFVIILPTYKEETSTLRETLGVLASHSQARWSYHVYLAMEEKEEKSDAKAAALIREFNGKFYRMSFTLHPEGIAGEAQGKSSNESWAGVQACRDYQNFAAKDNVIFTTMDADTHLSRRYFDDIALLHVTYPATSQTTMYIPPIVFDRNLHHVPLPVRTTDMMWAGAGISSLYTNSTVCIPTSVYSLPMTLLERVGGWDADPGAIGEDLHMYLKCFFALSGNISIKIVYAAASQCNVTSDLPGIMGYVDGLKARYCQALRHMWGCLDTGFAIRETAAMIKRQRLAAKSHAESHPSAAKHISIFLQICRKEFLASCSLNWTALYTSTERHQPSLSKLAYPQPLPIHWRSLLTLFIRLVEAHFLPVHLCFIMAASSIYTCLYPRHLIPDVLLMALDFAGWCRLAGWILMLCFFRRYAVYHKLCVRLRQEEMREAGLMQDHEDGFSPQVFPVAGLVEAMLFPLGGFLFGAIPALQAVLSHVFTDRLVYVVSLKPRVALEKLKVLKP